MKRAFDATASAIERQEAAADAVVEFQEAQTETQQIGSVRKQLDRFREACRS